MEATPGEPQTRGSGEDLRQQLCRIDGAGYKAYNDVLGGWAFGADFTVFIDKIQSDPFAPPSRCHLRVPMGTARFPPDTYNNHVRRTALCDLLTRAFCRLVKRGGLDQAAAGQGWSGPKGGDLQMDTPGQQVLERTSVIITHEYVEARFTVAMPAAGRNILGYKAIEIFCEALPTVVRQSLLYAAHKPADVTLWCNTVEDTRALRAALRERKLVAFVGDGAILPRAAGNSDVPMPSGAVPFQAPASLSVSVTLPHRGVVTGMGVPEGISLIVGGGFHGKSTLLQALQLGVYDHIPGDGRELVVCDADAVTVRAEDGRSVVNCDISPFISNLPFGRRTNEFSTTDASGSTSQAANILEALECGAKVLLIDEDTAATNFMVRDERMMQLVAKDKEPITPFIHKVRAMRRDCGVSTILVIGGCGDYFDVADCVIMQENYTSRDVTHEAKALARPLPADPPFGHVAARVPQREGVSAVREGDRPGMEKVSIGGKHEVRFGDQEINLHALHQIADKSQTRAIGDAIIAARNGFIDGNADLKTVLKKLDDKISREGLDALNPGRFIGNYARPRRYEVAAAMNRLRSVTFSQARSLNGPQ